MMQLWQYLYGVVTVELTSANISGALSAIRMAGLYIWDLETVDILTLRFSVKRRDWKRLQTMAQKRGDELRLLSKRGFFWHLLKLRKRPVLVVGVTLLLLFSLWVPGCVFFVQVEGNISIADREILETAAQCGIQFGATRRLVRSEKMKNALLEAMPSLSWAGVNTYGCTAVITVRERAVPDHLQENKRVSSIIAVRDGVVRQLTVLRGNATCKVGQVVKAGQVLISGYNDCGLCIQAVDAEGEVYAQTNRTLTAICPTSATKRGVQIGRSRKISLIIGKKRINFTNSSGISGAGCAKIYQEKYVTLPGGFVLPVAIAVETWTFYETETTEAFQGEAVIPEFCRRYLSMLMYSGRILQSNETMQQLDGFVLLQGSYSCYEMIGITRVEENIPNYVEND